MTERRLRVREAIREALDEALAADERVILLGEDIGDDSGGGVFGVTKGLSTKYGDRRVRTTPISEQAIMGAAVGAALAGLRPVAEIMLMNFMTLAMDMLTNHAAKLRYMSGGSTSVPLTVRTAAGAGVQFGAQHSEMLESWLVHTPGLKVVVPSNAADAKGLLTACIEDPDPCVFIEPTRLYGQLDAGVPSGRHVVPLGRAATRRSGTDVTVLTYGCQVADCLAAADLAAAQGISVEVIDLRSLVPLDEAAILESVARTGRAVIVHEAVRRGGYGAEIAAMLQEQLLDQLRAPVQRVAGSISPVPYARELETAWLPGVPDILGAVQRTVEPAGRSML